MILAEKYRPRTFSEFIGNTKAIKPLRRLAERGGLGSRAVWVSGASGTGKTTLARIVAGEIADPLNIVELVGRTLTVSDCREIARIMRFYGMGAKPGRAWVINEAHGLSAPVIECLLDLLESLPEHVLVIFTTTHDGQEALFDGQLDAGPLLSRCLPVRLTSQGLAPLFADRLVEIARTEGLNGHNGDSVKAALRIVQRCRNNLRAALQAVEAGELLE